MARPWRNIVLGAIAIAFFASFAACTKLDDLSTPDCAYTLTPSSTQFGNTGGTGTLTVQTANVCKWTVANNDPWVSISSERSGSGNGVLNFAVAANPESAGRTATFTVGSQSVSIAQSGDAGPNCNFVVDPTSGSFGAAGGGTATITVASQPNCGWGAVSQVPWITIGQGSPGSGNGAVQITIAANTGAARTGTVTVAGQAVSVTQAGSGGTCSYTAAPTSASYSATGGNGAITITTQAGCAWTATSQAPWITVTGGASGSGNGTVQYSVAANTGSASRTSSIVAGGQTITITQNGNGPTCMYGVSPTSASYSATAGSGNITVQTQAGCAWAATSQAAWLVVTSGASGTGNGTVQYTVAANTDSASRTSTITVATQTVTITQAGTAPACTYNAAPATAFFAVAGGAGTVTVTTQPGCAWTATSQAAWITITAGASGTGNGSIQYAVAANTGAGRTSTITVGGRTVTITQDGTSASPDQPY